MGKTRTHAILRDVAVKAGVSMSAVSRYLNGSISLPEQTAARIKASVQSLKYQPNPHARRLSRGKSDTIALVVPDISNMFFAQLAASVERSAAEHGLGVVLYVTENRLERELDYVERLSRNYVDAMLFVTNHDDDGSLSEAIARSGLVVLLDEDIAGAHAARVFSDNDAGGFMAARHLLSAGHRRLAYVGGPEKLMSARERAEGFRRAVAESGPPAELREIFGEYSKDFGRQVADGLVEGADAPTAIFAGSDTITLGILQALRRRGFRVPRDISIVTFDDVSPLEFFDPPITAIRQAVATMGQRGVELALGVGEGRISAAITERLAVELVDRASVGPPKPVLHRGR